MPGEPGTVIGILPNTTLPVQTTPQIRIPAITTATPPIPGAGFPGAPGTLVGLPPPPTEKLPLLFTYPPSAGLPGLPGLPGQGPREGLGGLAGYEHYLYATQYPPALLHRFFTQYPYYPGQGLPGLPGGQAGGGGGGGGGG